MGKHTTEAFIHEDDKHNEKHSATYCPEDDKLRIYINTYDGRVSRETYNYLRANGWTATPKQTCQFVCVWSVRAEDIALALIPEYDEIGDEDYSPEERAADRAERFNGYTGKRLDDATERADKMSSSPIGFQSQKLAASAEKRENRDRNHALTNWGKAEYWQRRTEGVIGHALHKSSPDVRRGRIKRLEAEQRKHQKFIDEHTRNWELWMDILKMDGNDVAGRMVQEGKTESTSTGVYITSPEYQGGKAFRFASTLSGFNAISYYKHPRRELDPSKYMQGQKTLYSLLHDDDDPITPKEAAEMWLGGRYDAPFHPDGGTFRYSRHMELRLAYEYQMLENEGGSADNEEMEVGGWYGTYRILKIHKSPATGKPVSLTLASKDKGKSSRINIQRHGEGHYRAPTEQEKLEFQNEQKESKKVAKESAPKLPPLLNPTDADAETLQQILNDERQRGSTFGSEPKKVVRITQAEYSSISKGSYARAETEGVTEKLELYHPSYYGGTNNYGQKVIFKVRIYSGSVVVLTDKPQKKLPFEECAELVAQHPSFMDTVLMIPDWSRTNYKEDMSQQSQVIFHEMRYHDLGYSSSQSQWGLSKLGHRWQCVLDWHNTGSITALYRNGMTHTDKDKNTNPSSEAKQMLAQLHEHLAKKGELCQTV